MNRSIWIPVAVTAAVLGVAGLAGPVRPPGAAPPRAAAAGAGIASAWRSASATGAAQFERLSARAWLATHSLRARVATGAALPAVPLEPVAWASMALATFAFVRALQLGRRAPGPHRRVLRLARRGVPGPRIARSTRMSQDAVRSLLQPAGQGSGRSGRHGLPFGRIGRRPAASDTARGRRLNAMA